ncbi:MAG TPA: lipoprotein-releasing ABC transporter permease subunit [Syntrophaceae bacterium]|nr:lipoprotein-releasing ABC transporter permease subunit [Syntrophaceae bacterium]
MTFELMVALRYLRAKRKQALLSLITFIAIAGITLGVMALIVVLAVMTGFHQELKTKIVGIKSHIILSNNWEKIRNYEHIINEIMGCEGVKSASPVISRQVMLSHGTEASGSVLNGIDLSLIDKEFLTVLNLKEGSLEVLENPTLAKPGIILGHELARNLGVILDDEVNVICPLGITTPMGKIPKMKTFKVTGIFDCGMYEYNAAFSYIPLKAAQNLLKMENAVTHIEIRVTDIYHAGMVAREIIKKLGPPYWARDWMQMHRSFFSALKLEKMVMFIILTLIVLVAAFGIVSTLIMMVTEKTGDIAILKSMGATERCIMKIFVFQGFIIGVMGTLLGLVCGVGLCEIQKRHPLPFTQLPSDVYYITTLPVKVDGTDITIIVLSAIIISLLATLYPSWQASRLDPAEALRYE